MTDHDRFEEFVKGAIQELDPVPPVPRDEMWARIDQARRFQRNAKKRLVPVWAAWGVGLAAMLAIGVGLGRWSMRDAQSPVPAVVDALPVDDTDDGNDEVERGNSFVHLPLNERKAVDIARRRERASTPEPAPVAPGNTAYQLVALQHLSRAEVLLTSIGTGSIDDQVTSWAKDMLSTTRLLLDSPASADPRMARLLEDLELILAQIASPAAQSQRELDMIQQGIRQTDVLPRLRAAMPAGTAIGI
jgi:hypothetical protein